MKILFTGGGTGGHIYPIVDIIRQLRKKYGEGISMSYIGPKDNFCKVVLSKEGIKVRNILSGKIRRYADPLSLIQNAIDTCIKLPLGMIQAFFELFLLIPTSFFQREGMDPFR